MAGEAGRRYEGFVPGRHLIDAYGAGGFRFAEMSHRGSILALPSGILAWPVESVEAMTLTCLDAAVREAQAIDILLIGTGTDLRPIRDALRSRLRASGIGADVMQTGAAARTYNILVAEKRRVAAALIAVP